MIGDARAGGLGTGIQRIDLENSTSATVMLKPGRRAQYVFEPSGGMADRGAVHHGETLDGETSVTKFVIERPQPEVEWACSRTQSARQRHTNISFDGTLPGRPRSDDGSAYESADFLCWATPLPSREESWFSFAGKLSQIKMRDHRSTRRIKTRSAKRTEK
jgi:hypothetical protein